MAFPQILTNNRRKINKSALVISTSHIFHANDFNKHSSAEIVSLTFYLREMPRENNSSKTNIVNLVFIYQGDCSWFACQRGLLWV